MRGTSKKVKVHTKYPTKLFFILYPFEEKLGKFVPGFPKRTGAAQADPSQTVWFGAARWTVMNFADVAVESIQLNEAENCPADLMT